MKIGIMSMQRIINYGSFMQALSLKCILEKLGHDVVFVDYRTEPNIEEKNSRKKRFFFNVRNFKRAYFNSEFINRILHKNDIHTHIMRSYNNILGIKDNYQFATKVDLLIIGSDEVFNCTQLGYNVGYSLELFGKNAKTKNIISYAASFGYTTFDKIKQYGVEDELKSYLKKFQAISVRDDNSFKIIKELCGKTPEIHMDPVMIGNLENRKWKQINQVNYIVIYGYKNRFTEEECADICRFAGKKSLKVIVLGEEQKAGDVNIFCSPEEIIEYFRHAEYVVTDTFHGTIFSVVTHKKFLTIARPTQDINGGNQEKITSLIKQLRLSDRLVKDFKSIDITIEQKIDYEMVESIRTEKRKEALDYLIREINRVQGEIRKHE